MFNSIINSQRCQKQRKKTGSRKKNRDTATPSSYSKFRNTFGDLMIQQQPSTTASGSTNSGGKTTTAALRKMLSNYKSQPAIHDVGAVNISSCNGKPLMIKVNNDAAGLMEYNNYLHQTCKAPVNIDTQKEVLKILDERQGDQFHSSPPWMQEMSLLKNKFVKVLNNYRSREQMLIARCKYLESELMKSRSHKKGPN